MAKKINYNGSSKILQRICEAINDFIDNSGGVVPSGGTTGQILAKNSEDDYDTYWKDESSGGSTVTVSQIQATGTKIATITVDGTETDLYAPSGGGGDTPRLHRTLKVYALDGELHLGGFTTD